MAEPAETQPSIEDRISALMNRGPEREDGDAPEEPEARTAERAEEPDDVETEDPTEPREAEPAPAEGDDAEVEEIEIAEIGDLAKHIGVDASELYNIEIPYTKDGERHAFTLGEVKDKLPLFSETLEKQEQAEATLQRYQQAEQQVQHQLQQQAAQMQALMEGVQDAMMAEMKQINWDELRQKDPGRWAALSEEYRRKGQQLQQIHQSAAQAFQTRQKEIQEHFQKNQQETLQREQQRLLRAIPEWRDEKTAEAERPRLVEYMRENGYTADEINAVTDHRALVLARKAWMFDQMREKGDVAKKKVVKLAKKIVKPGQRQTAREAQHDREKSLISAHRQNPKSTDAAAARIAMRIGRK